MRRSIEDYNVVVSTYGDDERGEDWLADPAKGNVGFGSGLQGWAFTLRDVSNTLFSFIYNLRKNHSMNYKLQFAKQYSAKFSVSEEKMMSRLWGENFFHPGRKVWTKKPAEGSKRGFNVFVLEPIMKVRAHHDLNRCSLL